MTVQMNVMSFFFFFTCHDISHAIVDLFGCIHSQNDAFCEGVFIYVVYVVAEVSWQMQMHYVMKCLTPYISPLSHK